MKYFLTLLLFCSLISCNNSDDDEILCTEVYIYGLNIMVFDSSNQQLIGDTATVTATDGNYSEELMFFTESFSGAGERAGDYIVTVTAEGYETYTTQTITLLEDECHVIPQSFNVQLIPN
ncbi:MAG: carboxypeptidase-like regulatory domain-containing protein [Flavobacteriaceae bacterium]|nr:carboxypeptidase-like regulatory domain-containing protein [Flavobacteriaceae bacterium]